MNPKDFRIFIDLDGVVADWVGKAVSTFGLNVNNHNVQQILSEDIRGIEQLVDQNHMWKVIDEGGAEWWDSIKPFPWAHYLYEQAQSFGRVCFLTQPSENPLSSAGKVAWITRHFKTRDYLLGKPKDMCASRYSFLIDDTPKKIKQFAQAGGNAVPFPNAFKYQMVNSAFKAGNKFVADALEGKDICDAILNQIALRQTEILKEDRDVEAAYALLQLRAGNLKQQRFQRPGFPDIDQDFSKSQ